MANTLTALQPTLFSAAQNVSSEPFGAISAINANFDDKGVAIGDTVSVPVAPSRSASTYVPGADPAIGADATATDVQVSITNNEQVSWHLSGEQMRSLENGTINEEWVRQLMEQGMRELRNKAEASCVSAIYKGASRATGTAGTNPFASALTPLVDARKILRDNGAPLGDLQFVGDSTSEANLLKLGVVLDASIAGSDEERRSGVIRRQYSFEMRTSAGIDLHTKGTATGLDAAGGEPIGETSIALDGGDGGSLLAGDIVTFAGDANKYVVNTGFTAASGTAVIGNPGLQATLADTTEMTIGNSYTPNLVFSRSAVVGVMRPPLIPLGGKIVEQVQISDTQGMTYLLVKIVHDGIITWRLHLAWGFKVVQSEHVATLLG